MTHARAQHGHDDSLERAPDWLFNGMSDAYGANAARLHIAADNPMALAEEDPMKVAHAAKANATAYKPALAKISGFEINWSIAAYPGRAWSKLVFPDLDDNAAQAALAKAIFLASHVDRPNPAQAWADYSAEFAARLDWLYNQNFAALYLTSGGTELITDLADGHIWMGGASTATDDVTCNPNIPTEEFITTPHKNRVSGSVRATKPPAHQGSIIEDIEVVFKDGVIKEAQARCGEEVFAKLLDTDEGARRIGEVALVPCASRISEG